MPRPGVELIERDSPPSRTANTDTGQALVTGFAEKGPALGHVTSLHDFEQKFGGRVTYSVLYDALEVAFREGLNSAYVARVAGSASVAGTANLYDTAGSTVADAALVATAKSVGVWGNALNVEVVAGSAGGLFEIVVSDDVDGELERSGDLADRTEAVAWAAFSDNIDLTEGASNEDPRVQGPTSFAGGSDEHTSAAEDDWTAALTKFTKNLGPGQVAAPGRSTSAAHTALLAHAAAFNRVAICDAPDSLSEATLKAAAASLESLANARYGGLFAPWVIAPGLVANSTRTIPPSAYVLGACARNDADTSSNPGKAPAGDNGRLSFVTDLRLTSADLTDDDYEELNDGSVNMIRYDLAENPEIYGFRTLVDKVDFPNHWQLSDMRALMAIRAQAEVIAERFVFAQIDGQGLKLGELAGLEAGMLLGYYPDMLYGATPDDAFRVNVGSDVNPPADLADGIIKVAISVRVSPFAELVQILLTKRAITEAVA